MPLRLQAAQDLFNVRTLLVQSFINSLPAASFKTKTFELFLRPFILGAVKLNKSKMNYFNDILKNKIDANLGV